MVKNLPNKARDVRDMGLIPGSVTSPGGGHVNLLQHSCPENPLDRGTWRVIQSMGLHRVRLNWSDLAHIDDLVVLSFLLEFGSFRYGTWFKILGGTFPYICLRQCEHEHRKVLWTWEGKLNGWEMRPGGQLWCCVYPTLLFKQFQLGCTWTPWSHIVRV